MDRVRRWMMLLSFVLAVLVVLPVRAATRQPVSLEYVDKYFTSVAAASCLGVYLPENSSATCDWNRQHA